MIGTRVISLRILVVLMLISGTVGCLQRRERIDIARDGGVLFTHMYKGSPEDFKMVDALPNEAAGWNVTTTVSGNEDEPKQTLVAVKRFAPDEPLPANLATPGDPDVDLRLQFPTTVTVESNGPETTYYWFERTYPARPWAYVQYWKDQILEDPELDDYKQRAVDELSAEAREEIVKALLGAESLKTTALARFALRECGLDTPRRRLDSRRAILDVYMEPDRMTAMIDACADLESEQRDACFDEAVTQLSHDSQQALLNALAGSEGWSNQDNVRFRRCLERSQLRYRVTEQVGGHGFEVMVQLPGTVVSHNGDSAEYDADRKSTLVKWEFDGTAFRDRTHWICAVSRVNND